MNWPEPSTDFHTLEACLAMKRFLFQRIGDVYTTYLMLS